MNGNQDVGVDFQEETTPVTQNNPNIWFTLPVWAIAIDFLVPVILLAMDTGLIMALFFMSILFPAAIAAFNFINVMKTVVDSPKPGRTAIVSIIAVLVATTIGAIAGLIINDMIHGGLSFCGDNGCSAKPITSKEMIDWVATFLLIAQFYLSGAYIGAAKGLIFRKVNKKKADSKKPPTDIASS